MRVFGVIMTVVVIATTAVTFAYSDECLDVLDKDASQLLHDHLLRTATKQYEERENNVAVATQSTAAAREYKAKIQNAYEKLIVEMPDKTPLNARKTGEIQCRDYCIGKVVYESRPHHHVTASLYIPNRGTGPFPAVLVTCGHSTNGKARDTYQSVSILLAKNGIVALLVDPIGQGERLQIAYREGEQDLLAATARHTQLDIGSMLVGTDVVFHQMWDNIRSIDYLCSRPDVDPDKIGVTGHSGGGTQTMYLMAYDSRITAAVPSCGLSTRQGHLATCGAADGCHHIAHEGLRLLEYSDYIIMFAPKPCLVLAAEHDQFFDIDDVAFSVREATWFYQKLSTIDRMDMFTVDMKHAFPTQSRESVVWWFKRWLQKEKRAVVEPDLTIQQEAGLWATKTGQVMTAFKDETSVIDLNVDTANTLAKKRSVLINSNSTSSYISKLKNAVHYQESDKPTHVLEMGGMERKDRRIKKMVLQRSDNVPLPALFCEPLDHQMIQRPATIVISSRGKNAEFGADGVVQSELKAGRVVLAVDLRGFGETTDDPGNLRKGWRQWNRDHRINQLSLHIGRPILIQRVEDTIIVLEYLLSMPRIHDKTIKLIGVGDGGIVALHAAAFDERFASVTVMNTISSWLDIVKAPLARNQLRNVIPGALQYYDLPDLVKVIEPRTVEVVNPVDAHGHTRD